MIESQIISICLANVVVNYLYTRHEETSSHLILTEQSTVLNLTSFIKE